jgi:hypothetical protein
MCPCGCWACGLWCVVSFGGLSGASWGVGTPSLGLWNDAGALCCVCFVGGFRVSLFVTLRSLVCGWLSVFLAKAEKGAGSNLGGFFFHTPLFQAYHQYTV